MGDGTVALILDVLGLASRRRTGRRSRASTPASAQARTATARRRHGADLLLIVDFGDTGGSLCRLSMVSRLEKFATSAIEYADGREVIQYRGAIMPLVRLSDVLRRTPTRTTLTTGSADRRLCRAVAALRLGRRPHRRHRRNRTSSSPASDDQNDDLLGTVVIQQRVTDLLNLR